MSGQQTVGRALRVLETISEYPEGIGVALVADVTGLSPPTVHRLLQALVERGYAEQNEADRKYRMGPTVLRLARRHREYGTLVAVARPILEQLGADTGETIFLSTRRGVEMVYLDVIESPAKITMTGRVGDVGPLHATSQGRALLWSLPEVDRHDIVARLDLTAFTDNTVTDRDQLEDQLEIDRLRGFSVQDQERDEGVVALAVPLLDSTGYPLGAIAVGAPAFRVDLDRLTTEFLELVRAAALQIQRRVEGGGPPKGATSVGVAST